LHWFNNGSVGARDVRLLCSTDTGLQEVPPERGREEVQGEQHGGSQTQQYISQGNGEESLSGGKGWGAVGKRGGAK